jgi:hypothetical protein
MQTNATTSRTPSRTPPNVAALQKLALLGQAIESLDREGHEVADVDLSSGKPTVQLLASAKLAAMASDGRAGYYMRGVGTDGRAFRKGILLAYRNVNVVWVERGH